MEKLPFVLNNYGIKGEVAGIYVGPLLKIIEFTPAPGTKIRTVTAAAEDIRRELGVSSLRIEPAGEGNNISFEIPADNIETVDFDKVLSSEPFKTAAEKQALPLALGVNAKGQPYVADLAKMPHLLIGGTTGSGKSVGLNTFILSLMAAKKPSELKFVLIDPKKIEFSTYNDQRYLLTPVVTETDEAALTLAYLAKEMDNRYAVFAKAKVKNLAEYNEKMSVLPYIVCVIDEFADLMAVDKKVEKDVMRLAQKARAAGIHLILATQRPSVDVVTGVLKANFPARLAYKTASSTDSRTILDDDGAEQLLGRGDCLYLAPNGTLVRLHGAYADDISIETMLEPHRAKVKPIELPKEETQTKELAKAETKKADKPNIFVRAWRWWRSLRVKDQQLIIKGIKYAFAFFAGRASKRRK